MKLRINIWQIYFLTKIIYMFIALFVISQFTSLGDSGRYLNAKPFMFVWSSSSSDLMDFLGGTFSYLFGKIFANIPFILISFYGVYYPIKKLKLKKKQLILVLTLLSFPSFGIWTSIISKEAFAVFYMGLILGYLIDLIKGNLRKDYLFLFVGLFLCWIFKPQYLVGILITIVFIYLHDILNLKKEQNLLSFILMIIGSLMFLYIFRNEINNLAFEIPKHFSVESHSTRPNDVWMNKNDIFWKAPYGMIIGFFGPTIDEAISKPIHLIVFIESSIIMIIFLYAVINLFLISFATGKFNIYYFGIFFIILSWILFVHYPMGILNPGSAVRYRQGFYSFLVILFFFLHINILKRDFELKK